MCLNLIIFRENLTDSNALELQRQLQRAGIYSIVSASDFKNPESSRNLMILREDLQMAQSVTGEEEIQCTN